MNKLHLVIEREFTTRLRKKSFWVMTFVMPLLILFIGFVPVLVSSVNEVDQQQVAILDHTGRYASLFEGNDSDSYRFVRVDRPLDSLRSEASQESITAILEIRGDLLKDPKAISLFSFKQLPQGLETYINEVLSRHLTEEKIRSYNIPQLQEAIQESQVQLRVSTYKWGESGYVDTSSSTVASIIGVALSFFSYLFMMTYGGMVLQGVLEEKKNRIVEVIISSVRPQELMLGKIIGIGLLGLVQIAIWAILFFVGAQIAQTFFLSSGGAEVIGETSFLSQVTTFFAVLHGVDFAKILIFFILFFVGGYLFYASILAALSSLVSSDEEASQMMMPVVILLILSMYAGMGSVDNPDGTLAFWASFCPLTSPVVMMVRLPYDVPLWQPLLSLAILYITVFLTSALAGKIYRTGILMYGKKPSMREVWRWITYRQ